MNHPMVDRIERTGSPFPFKKPSIARCQCGCGESVSLTFCHTVYEDEFFIDNSHVIKHLKQAGVLTEVG